MNSKLNELHELILNLLSTFALSITLIQILKATCLFYTRPKKLFFLFCLLFFSITSFAQKTIEIISSDLLEMQETPEGKMKTLSGSVVLKQDDVLLYCDKADFMDWNNTVYAKGNVKVKQGDSVTLYCRDLVYRGNEKKMTATEMVRLEKGKAVLITDKLDYDIKKKRGWFQNGGKLISDSTLLISQNGEYFAQSGDANFYQKVKVTNPAYTLQADTFQFNTEQKINYFHGPTNIQLDTNQVYCEGGRYELNSGNSLFTKNASLKNKRQSLFGDSISWNKKTSSGWAAGKVRLTDTLEQTSITAAHLIFKNNPKTVIAFGVPWLTLFSTKDTVFINADTLYAVTFQQKAVAKDTFNHKDSISINLLRAWNNVHLYNRQFQAISDSASYSSLDSIFRLFHNPILWIDSSQLFADTVYLIQKNKVIQQIQLLQNGFIASHIVSNYYNQLSGKKIIGYFTDNKLSSLFVKGTAKSLYFSQEENGAFAGINKSASSSMKVMFEAGKVSQIRFYGQPDAAFSPIIHYPKSDLFFKEFKWQPALRPNRAMVGK